MVRIPGASYYFTDIDPETKRGHIYVIEEYESVGEHRLIWISRDEDEGFYILVPNNQSEIRILKDVTEDHRKQFDEWLKIPGEKEDGGSVEADA